MSHGISDKVMSGIDQIKQDPYKIPLSKMNVANPYLFHWVLNIAWKTLVSYQSS